jgi:hypothetical protein
MAISNVDKLLGLISKAQDTLLDAADILDQILIESAAVGGQIAQIIPPHIQSNIDKITALVDSQEQSSLSKLDDLISNMPIRSIKSASPSERREARKQAVDVNPNTSGGPQSAMQESWRSMARDEPDYPASALNFNTLRESELFNHDEEEPLIEVTRAKPIDTFAYKQRIRETINNDANEEEDDESEALRESLDSFDLSKMVGIPGSVDGLPSFGSLTGSSLREGGTLEGVTVR